MILKIDLIKRERERWKIFRTTSNFFFFNFRCNRLLCRRITGKTSSSVGTHGYNKTGPVREVMIGFWKSFYFKNAP